MKKLILFITALFLLNMQNVKAWDSNITGGGAGPGEGGIECYDGSGYNCYNACNGGWFFVLKVSLIYYDGSSYKEIKSPILVGDYSGYAPASNAWIQAVFGSQAGNIHHWTRLSGLNYKSSGFANRVKNAVDADLNWLLGLMGTSTAQVESDIRNGKYPKHKRASGNINDTGVRLIVQPLYGFSETYDCYSYPRMYYGTIQAIASIMRGSHMPMTFDRAQNYAHLLELQKDDIGHRANYGDGSYDALASGSNGYGMGIFTPWDNTPVDPRCNPDYEGIYTCCDRYGIYYGNEANNTSGRDSSGKPTGNLTRKLTRDEIARECPKKCDVNAEGVEFCCAKYGITPKENHKYNTTQYLTRVITAYELENSTCNPEFCKYTFEEKQTPQCDVSNIGYITDANNEWRCVFTSSKSKYSEVKNHFKDLAAKNDYCEIYCTEKVSYELPKKGTVTHAGQSMYVMDDALEPTIWPIKYKVEKICRTTAAQGDRSGKINYEKFEEDINKLNTAMKNAWNAYRIYQTRQKACSTGGKASYDGKEYTCDKPDYSSEINKAKKDYEILSKGLKSAFSQINQCNNHIPRAKLEPQLKLTYEEPIYGDTFNLKPSSIVSTIKTKYYRSGNATDGTGDYQKTAIKTQIRVADCKTENCNSFKYVTYDRAVWVETNYTKELEYKLDGNVYKYISKYSNRSFHTPGEAGEFFETMRFSNLPTHLSTLPGDYPFKIYTSTIDDTNKFYKYFFSGNTFAGKKYNYKKTYNCTYNISCEQVFSKKDCDAFKAACPDEYSKHGCTSSLIFRPIPLTKASEGHALAFLTQDGKKRDPGKNWNNASVVDAIILNNRNVEGNNVYKLDPMYEITLTPQLMNKIREYNSSQNKKIISVYGDSDKSTTGVAGYTSYTNFEMKDGHFISNNIRNWGVRGCAIALGKGSYSKCNGVHGAW